MDTHSPYLTAAEAAKYLSVSLNTIRRLAASGRLPEQRISDRVIRFRVADLDALAGGRVHEEPPAPVPPPLPQGWPRREPIRDASPVAQDAPRRPDLPEKPLGLAPPPMDRAHALAAGAGDFYGSPSRPDLEPEAKVSPDRFPGILPPDPFRRPG